MSIQLPQSAKFHYQQLGRLLGDSEASLRIRKITIHLKDGPLLIRPLIHPAIAGDIGTGKSTLLDNFTKSIPTVPIVSLNDMTIPALVGSIDQRSNMFVPAAAWEARNGFLILDEFSLDRNATGWRPFLSLLEGVNGRQEFSRKIARYCAESKQEDEELYCVVKDGTISIRTNFVVLIATMRPFEYVGSQYFRALITRTIPYRYKFNTQDLLEIGKHHVTLKPFIRKPQPEYNVKSRIYNKVLDFTAKHLEGYDERIRNESLLRTSQDIIRVFCAESNFDWEYARYIVYLKAEALKVVGSKWKPQTDSRHERFEEAKE